MPNYNVPSQRTSYICYPYTLPTDEDYHAIRFDSIVEHSSVVHHIVLYTCGEQQSSTDVPFIFYFFIVYLFIFIY